jgi:hypothetical protein
VKELEASKVHQVDASAFLLISMSEQPLSKWSILGLLQLKRVKILFFFFA